LEAEAVAKADRELKNQLGVLAYLLAGAPQIATHEIFEAQIEIITLYEKIDIDA